jgi:hypothetical protein
MSSSPLRIAGVVALYFVVSISMVFVNKELLSGQTVPAPLFVTWFQCLVTIGICVVLGEVSSQRCVRWLIGHAVSTCTGFSGFAPQTWMGVGWGLGAAVSGLQGGGASSGPYTHSCRLPPPPPSPLPLPPPRAHQLVEYAIRTC